MKISKYFIKKNPVQLNIPIYSFGGAIDRLNFSLNSLLLFTIISIALLQDVTTFSGQITLGFIVLISLILQSNNVFKRYRDIYGKEISFSDKCFFAFLNFVPLVNILMAVYLGYKIGYLEIIKRRNALLKEMT